MIEYIQIRIQLRMVELSYKTHQDNEGLDILHVLQDIKRLVSI